MDTKYLIVGGGMTADAAVKGIREHDVDGSIVLVGAEPHPPYKRPPLTKGLWSGGDEAKIWKNTADAGAELISGVGSSLSTSRPGAQPTIKATTIGYEKILLATGGTPRRLGGADDQVIYYRTLDDFRKLKQITEGGATSSSSAPASSARSSRRR